VCEPIAMIRCRLRHLEARCRERGYTLEQVRPCILSEDGDRLTVDETHPSYPRARPRGGPGSELKALLGRFGIHASPTCKCNSMAKKMDDMESKEPGWSMPHIEEIVDVMEETARARKLPFLRAAGRLLVKKAVRNWQKKAIGK